MNLYRCCRCFHEYVAPSGPTECPNCGFIYIIDVAKQIQYEAIKKGDDLNVEPRTDEACG